MNTLPAGFPPLKPATTEERIASTGTVLRDGAIGTIQSAKVFCSNIENASKTFGGMEVLFAYFGEDLAQIESVWTKLMEIAALE